MKSCQHAKRSQARRQHSFRPERLQRNTIIDWSQRIPASERRALALRVLTFFEDALSSRGTK